MSIVQRLENWTNLAPRCWLSPGFRAPRRWACAHTVQSHARDLCFWHMFRHSLMFQSGLSQTHSDLLDRADLPPPYFLGKRMRRVHPQLLITCQCLLPRLPVIFSITCGGVCGAKGHGGTSGKGCGGMLQGKHESSANKSWENALVWPRPHN